MALIKCKDCGYNISKSAKSCPQCGNLIKKSSFLGKLFKIVIVFIVLIVIFSFLIIDNAGGNRDATSKYNKLLLESEHEYKPAKEDKMTGECWDKLNSHKNKYYTEECQKYREETGDEEYQRWNEQRKRNNEKLLEVIEKGSKY